MAYKIQYTPEDNHRYPNVAEKKFIPWGKVVTTALIVLSGIWMWHNGIPDFLIPGDPVQTKAAANTMLEQLKEGQTIESAITTFCREIIDGAQY